MKTVSFLILIVFILSLCMSAAPVRAAGESLVYIALVTQRNPQVPLALQAQMEFRKLAPMLLSAQEAGRLIDFNTEFSVGVVMLRLAGRAAEAADAATRMFGRPVYRDVNDALRAVPRQGPTQRVAAAVNAQFYVDTYESCFWGAVPVNSHIFVILRDDTNVVLSKARVNEQDDGAADGWFNGCFDWSYYNEVAPGYKVTFKVYDAPGGTLLGTFIGIAPALTFTSLNKATAEVAGTGPANKLFELYWSQPRLNAGGAWAENTIDGTISAARQWSGDVSTGKIRGDAYIEVRVFQTPNIAFIRNMLAARIHCGLGGNFCDINGFPFQTVTLKVTRGTTTYTFNGRADGFGWFGVNVRTPAGLPFRLKAGDKVQGTGVPLYTLPALNLNAFDFVNDVVSGKAVPNRFFSVSVDTDSTADWHWYWIGSNAQGDFSVDTTADFDLVSTEISEAELWYTDPVTGNITGAYRLYVP